MAASHVDIEKVVREVSVLNRSVLKNLTKQEPNDAFASSFQNCTPVGVLRLSQGMFIRLLSKIKSDLNNMLQHLDFNRYFYQINDLKKYFQLN